jgi:hypothetical protein
MRHQHADASYALTLLRAHRERPRRRRPAEQRDEPAALTRSPRRRGRAASASPALER